MDGYIQFLIAVNLTTITVGLIAIFMFCSYGMYKAIKDD